MTKEPTQATSVESCEWSFDEDSGAYDTECGTAFFFDSGTRTDNSFKFCPFCGQKIQEIAQ